jgi:ATP-dependent Clp protease ATP-binding subunit ClpB
MDFNRLTEKSQDAIRQAQSIAANYGNQQVDVEHLVLALLEQEGGLAPSILMRADVLLEPLHRRLVQEVEKLPKVSGGAVQPDQLYVTNRLSRLLTAAEEQAKRLKDDYVSIEHLLLAAVEDQGAAGRILREFGLTRDRLMKALVEVRGNQRVTTPNPETTYEALQK